MLDSSRLSSVLHFDQGLAGPRAGSGIRDVGEEVLQPGRAHFSLAGPQTSVTLRHGPHNAVSRARHSQDLTQARHSRHPNLEAGFYSPSVGIVLE